MFVYETKAGYMVAYDNGKYWHEIMYSVDSKALFTREGTISIISKFQTHEFVHIEDVTAFAK